MPGPNSPKLSAKASANLPLARKAGDRVAHFLDLGEAELVVAEPGVEALDARIVAGALDRVEKVAQGRLLPSTRRDKGLRSALRQAAGQVGGQDHIARQGRLVRRQLPDEKAEPRRREHDDKAEYGEKSEDDAQHGASVRVHFTRSIVRRRDACGERALLGNAALLSDPVRGNR